MFLSWLGFLKGIVLENVAASRAIEAAQAEEAKAYNAAAIERMQLALNLPKVGEEWKESIELAVPIKPSKPKLKVYGGGGKWLTFEGESVFSARQKHSSVFSNLHYHLDIYRTVTDQYIVVTSEMFLKQEQLGVQKSILLPHTVDHTIFELKKSLLTYAQSKEKLYLHTNSNNTQYWSDLWGKYLNSEEHAIVEVA